MKCGTLGKLRCDMAVYFTLTVSRSAQGLRLFKDGSTRIVKTTSRVKDLSMWTELFIYASDEYNANFFNEAEEDNCRDDDETCEDPSFVWVNVYRVTRHRGGGEEGGWWYNHKDCIQSAKVPAYPISTSMEYVELLREENKDQGWGDIYSANGGASIWIDVEGKEAETETRERPRYC